MPQYIQYPNYVTSASSTSTAYTIPYTTLLERGCNISAPTYAETNESPQGAVRDLQAAVDLLRRQIDDVARVSLKTENAMRSLKEYLDEYEAVTIPVEDVMQFFWKDDDGE